MKQTAFQAGDRVVIPPYGIGVIQGTCERPVAGQPQAFYQIEFASTTSRAYVPVVSVGNSGMRAALTAHDMGTMLDHLTGVSRSDLDLPRQWAARHRRVTEILAGGNPYELASLICELRRWHAERSLPDLDRQALRRALKLLDQEVQGLHDREAGKVKTLLNTATDEMLLN